MSDDAETRREDGIRGESSRSRLSQGMLFNIGIALSVAVLAAVGWQSFLIMMEMNGADRWVNDTYITIQESDRLLSALKDVEGGQRCYLLTGQEWYLEPYAAALEQVDTRLRNLKALTLSDGIQQERLTRIHPLIQQQLAEIKNTIELRRTQGSKTAIAKVAIDSDQNLMETICTQVRGFQDEEERLLKQRIAAKDAGTHKTFLALLFGGGISVILQVAVFLRLRQESVRRVRAETEVRQHRDQLQERVAERTAELAQLNEQLKDEIQEHQKAKLELLRQGEWLQVTLRSIGDSVLTTDTAGVVTFLNPVGVRLTGWTLEQAQGQTVQSVFRLSNPNGENLVADVLREGVVIALPNHSALISREGHTVPIEGSAAPIINSAGNVSGAVLVFQDVTEKRRTQETLRLAQLSAEVGVYDLNLPTGELTFTPELERMYGLKSGAIKTREDWRRRTHPDDVVRVEREQEEALANHKPFDLEFRIFHTSGEVRWMSAKGGALYSETGEVARVLGVNIDITARKQSEEKLRSLNRTLKALSNSNQALMRASSELEYLEKVCSIVVEDCGCAMVWIGFAEHNEGRTVRPVAQAGFEEGYLETLNVTWADNEFGRGPTGVAIRSGKPKSCCNMQTDPAFLPWREQAIKRGYASSLALPLFDGGKTFGALTIYSSEPDAFSPDETALFSELADDLSCGVTSIRLRKAHAQAEEALRVSEVRYRQLFELSPQAIFINRHNGIEFVNPAALRLFGATDPSQILGKTPFDLFHPDYHEIIRERIRNLSPGKIAPQIEEKIVRLDGVVVDVEVTASPFIDMDGRADQVILRDISERKETEAMIKRLASFPELNPSPIAEVDLNGQVHYVNPTAHSLFPDLEERGMLHPWFAGFDFTKDAWLAGSGSTTSREVKVGNRFFQQMVSYVDRGQRARIYAMDITERKLAEEALHLSHERLNVLAQSASELLKSESPQEVINSLCQRIMVSMDCQLFFSFLVDDQESKLRLNACAGISEAQMREIEFLFYKSGVSGDVACNGRPFVGEDLLNNLDPRTELIKTYGVQAYACYPLVSHGAVLGTLSFGTRTRKRFAEEELELMNAVADQVAIALERKRNEEALCKVNEVLEQRVTQRTAALHAVSLNARQSETRYRSLVTASAQIVWTTDAQGEVVTDMPTWRAFTGQSFENIQGWGWSDALHPDDLERTKAVWLKAVNSQKFYEVDYRMRRHDGEYRHMTVRGVPVLESDGRIREWVGACADITERKEDEKRREVTRALLELFAEKTFSKAYLDGVVKVIREWTGCHGMGIRLTDENENIPYESWAGFAPGFIQLENRLSLKCDNCLCVRAVQQRCDEQESMLLTSGGSFSCGDLPAFLGRLSHEKLSRYRGSCIKSGFASVVVLPIRYHDRVLGAIHLADHRPNHFPAATVEFIETMSPLIGEALQRFSAEAELSRYRDRLEDLVKQRTTELRIANLQLQNEVAERKRAQETLGQVASELERSNRDLEQFAYAASHDLQEPLRAVSGYVQLLERRYPEKLDSKGLLYIKEAVNGAARMQKLISDLLAFSRLGSQGGDFKPVDLNIVLAQALANLQVSVQETGARITSDPLPTLAADTTQIGQLFQNLIGNAIKFRGDRLPEIHVSAERQEGHWLLAVRDNGIGIEPQYFDRVFQLFQRLHTRKSYAGTGIGLTLCKRIVERHGGSIWIESQPGLGATFFFVIPDTKTKPNELEKPTDNRDITC